MRVESITPSSRGHDQLSEILRSVYGWAPFQIEREACPPQSFIPALFSGDRLIAFVILEDYRTAQFHLGNEISRDVATAVLSEQAVKLYLIRQFHGDPVEAWDLKKPVARLLDYTAATLRDQGKRCCFLASLYENEDEKSRALYQALGFKVRGAPSYRLLIDPHRQRGKPPAEARVAPGMRAAFLDEWRRIPCERLARAYNEVFCRGEALLTARDLDAVTTEPEFVRELSLVIRDEKSERITGFLLADRPEKGTVRVICAGLVREVRSRGIVKRAFRLFLERCTARGVVRVVFVTGKTGMRRMAIRTWEAIEEDRMIWMLQCR